MNSAGVLSEFARPGWTRALLVVAVNGDDGHLKIMVDSFQHGPFAIFEYVDAATGFVVASLTHRASGSRVRLFASLVSAAHAAELAQQAGDWANLTPQTAGEQTELWERTQAAWRTAGFERASWFPSPDAADSLTAWGSIGERPRLAMGEPSPPLSPAAAKEPDDAVETGFLQRWLPSASGRKRAPTAHVPAATSSRRGRARGRLFT